jgi:N-carbamoylputrescine amidase
MTESLTIVKEEDTMATRQLRVAAVQMECQPGRVQANLDRASHFVEEAARRGAQLVLLPELMPSGYLLTEELWNYAEPFNGPTVAWLKEIAERLGIYVGTSFLEAEGEDFYNAFALATPAGQIAGRVRKSPPASLEAYFYRGGNDSHVLETPVGRIGVGICYENLLFERLNDLYEAGVDLVLQPAAAGRLKPIIPGDIKRFDRTIRRCAPHYARTLGVPVILADRAGPLYTELPGGFPEFRSSFPGLSMIVDADGSIKAELGEEEGVIITDVQLDPALKAREKPRDCGEPWAFSVPWYAFIWPLTQKQGELAYEQDSRRTERALRVGQVFLERGL